MVSNEEPILVKMALIDQDFEIMDPQSWGALESKLRIQLTTKQRALWTSIQGARTPMYSSIYSSDSPSPSDDPDVYSMSFFSARPEQLKIGAGLNTNLSFQYSHFDSQNWVLIGRRDATELLWSTEKQRFGTIFVHEINAPPKIIQSGLEAFSDNVFLNVRDVDYIEELSEDQCELLFREVMTPTLRQYFHLACRGNSEATVAAAIILDVPSEKLREVFDLNRKEINKPVPSSYNYPINFAAQSGRVDALIHLVRLGADMSVGENLPFAVALRSGDFRFARTMIRLGYQPKTDSEKQLIDSRLDDELSKYVMR